MEEHVVCYGKSIHVGKRSKAMGRGVRRMPFRKALKRDIWEQSPEAVAVGERWIRFAVAAGMFHSVKIAIDSLSRSLWVRI